MFKIKKQNGQELSIGALTQRYITDILQNKLLDDYVLLMKYAQEEGSQALQHLLTLDPYIRALYELQPEIFRSLIVIYQLGMITGYAIHKNDISLEEVEVVSTETEEVADGTGAQDVD